MDDNRSLPYFFLGLGVGVAVGMIFAPKAGAETRSLIRDRATEGGDYIRRRTNALSEEVRDRATGLMDKGKDMVDKGKGVMDRQREQLNAAVDAGRQAYRDTVASTGGTPATDFNTSSEGI